jgi:predicted small integral membrane protein
MDLSWMAWTPETATFFACIAAALALMTGLQMWKPSIERVGVLGVATTRGDRLFVTLLGSAFICLAWLGLIGPETLWWSLAACAVYGAAVFRWV